MLPTNLILDAIADLLANDTTTIAPAALPCHLHLAMAPFTPSAGLVIGGLTPADFDGSTPINLVVGAQDNFRDPITGLRIVQLIEPAGGLHWDVTGVTNLPQTIYGWYVTDNADALVFGSGLFPTPIPLGAIGQGIDLPWVRFTFSNGSPT